MLSVAMERCRTGRGYTIEHEQLSGRGGEGREEGSDGGVPLLTECVWKVDGIVELGRRKESRLIGRWTTQQLVIVPGCCRVSQHLLQGASPYLFTLKTGGRTCALAA